MMNLFFDQHKLQEDSLNLHLSSSANQLAYLEGQNTCVVTSCKQQYPRKAAAAQEKDLYFGNFEMKRKVNVTQGASDKQLSFTRILLSIRQVQVKRHSI